MLLLPDQTYEQCQDLLTPLIVLKRLLTNADFRPKIEIDLNGKKSTNNAATIRRSYECQFRGQRSNGESNGTTPTDEDVENEIRIRTPNGYEHTSEFFNNIPEFNGEPLGPFSIPNTRETSKTTADLLKECEMFLYKYRIKPDFFCRYRKAME